MHNKLCCQLTHNRNVVRCFWNLFGDDQLEDGKRQYDGDLQRDFLPGFHWQKERKHHEEGQHPHGHDEHRKVE